MNDNMYGLWRSSCTHIHTVKQYRCTQTYNRTADLQTHTHTHTGNHTKGLPHANSSWRVRGLFPWTPSIAECLPIINSQGSAPGSHRRVAPELVSAGGSFPSSQARDSEGKQALTLPPRHTYPPSLRAREKFKSIITSIHRAYYFLEVTPAPTERTWTHHCAAKCRGHWYLVPFVT